MSTGSMADKASLNISEKFCDADADLEFISSDQVLLKVHSIYLTPNSGALASQGLKCDGEVIALQEDGTTLEFLFSFVYPRRHPDMKNVSFDVLNTVSEAVEKYEIFAGINICKVRMELCLSEHPYEVFLYAYKHGYRELLAATAPLLLHKPLSNFIQGLPADLVHPWVEYWEKWHEAVLISFTKPAFSQTTDSSHRCYAGCHGSEVVGPVMQMFYKNPETYTSPASAMQMLERAFLKFQGSDKSGRHTFAAFKPELEKNLLTVASFDSFVYPN